MRLHTFESFNTKKILIINLRSPKIPQIGTALSEIGYYSNMIPWENYSSSDLNGVSALILSGSPMLLTELDHAIFIDKFSFIKDLDIPVLGICFGHQLLGVLFGATIFRGNDIRKDIDIDILRDDEIFNGLPNPVVMKAAHTEGITLPEDFIHLASSDSYEIEAMKHKTKTIYGLQFHPEKSGEPGKILLNNFCNMMK